MTPEFEKAARDAIVQGLQVETGAIDSNATLIPAHQSSFHVAYPQIFIARLNDRLGTKLDLNTMSENPRARTVGGLLALLEEARLSQLNVLSSASDISPDKELAHIHGSVADVVASPLREAQPVRLCEPSVFVSGSVEERVIDIVADHFDEDPEDITLDTSFENDLGATSLKMVELALEIEDKMDVSMSSNEIERMTQVKEYVEFVAQHCE